MVQKNEFMLVFRLTPSNTPPTAEQIADMHQQWGGFIGSLAIQEKLVSTHRLGFTGATVLADKTTTEGICVSENLAISGNMIVQVATLAEATEIAKNCPILLMGGMVEVRSIEPM